MNFAKKLDIPHKPGVYIFKDAAGKILYVGKAVDLFHRVSSYFRESISHPRGWISKTTVLVKNISTVETIIVSSEIEALLLEANLIKKYLPPYNIRLTDNKDYLYIKITRETFPKIITARKNELSNARIYFGPFPSARIVRDTLKKLRRIFPWCSKPLNAKPRPCFHYHLGLCPGPCIDKIGQKDYGKIISHFIKFMQGKNNELREELNREMNILSKNREFEGAQEIKKNLNDLSYLTQSTTISGYLENPNFLQNQHELALRDLKEQLNLLVLPKRIECYDVSNILGKQATGSMVVLTHGEVDKGEYRKFKIRTKNRPNDTAMIGEVIRRRFKHKEWSFPDLILVDGGQGQVNVASLELGKWKLEIPVFGLAKRMEWIYGSDGKIIKLPHSSSALLLLQRIRDEAHRFAISYHRKLRSKMLY